jgi:hypothetical protein
MGRSESKLYNIKGFKEASVGLGLGSDVKDCLTLFNKNKALWVNSTGK